jgi:tetratricopeptide (TPR) repeat protein
VALLAVALAIYCWSLPFPTVSWDDNTYIEMNPWLLNLSWPNIVGIFQHTYFVNYHPLTVISYMIDVHLFGYAPWWIRLVNIVLHALTVIVLWRWLLLLGASRWLAFGGALLFLVHPQRVESVVWISERKDVLCGLFYVLALWAWTKADLDGRRSVQWLSMALLSLLLSLMAKAMAVSLPLVWLAYDLFLRRQGPIAPRLATIAIGVALAVTFARLNVGAQDEALRADVPFLHRIGMALYAPLFYTQKAIWPQGLSPLYPIEFRPSQTSFGLVLAAIFSASALAVVVYCSRRAPQVSFGLIGAAICLGPVSGIVSFGSAFAADRYSYLPTAILMAGLAAPAIQQSIGVIPQRIAAISFVGVFGAFAWINVELQQAWRSSAAVWDRALEIYPDSWVSGMNRDHAAVIVEGGGVAALQSLPANPEVLETAPRSALPSEYFRMRIAAFRRAGDLAKARQLAEESRPANLAAALHDLRIIAMDEGNLDEAAGYALELIRMVPPPAPEFLTQATGTLVTAGRYEEAIQVLEQLTQPSFGAAASWGLIAFRAAEREDWPLAIRAGRRALAIHPSEYNGLQGLDRALMATGDRAGAIRVLRRAASHQIAESLPRFYAQRRLALLADDPQALRAAYTDFNLRRVGRGGTRSQVFSFVAGLAEEDRLLEEALRFASLAVQLDSENVDALHTLALLRIRQGRGQAALNLLERAHRLDPEDDVVAQNLARLRARLAGS